MKLIELLNDSDALKKIHLNAEALGFEKVRFLFDRAYTGATEMKLTLLANVKNQEDIHKRVLLVAKLGDELKLKIDILVEEKLSEFAKDTIADRVFNVDNHEKTIAKINEHLTKQLKYPALDLLTLKAYSKKAAEKAEDELEDANKIIQAAKKRKTPEATSLPFFNGQKSAKPSNGEKGNGYLPLPKRKRDHHH